MEYIQPSRTTHDLLFMIITKDISYLERHFFMGASTVQYFTMSKVRVPRKLEKWEMKIGDARTL